MVEREATTPRPVCLSNTRQKRPNQRRRVVHDDKQRQAVGQPARVQRITRASQNQKGERMANRSVYSLRGGRVRVRG